MHISPIYRQQGTGLEPTTRPEPRSLAPPTNIFVAFSVASLWLLGKSVTLLEAKQSRRVGFFGEGVLHEDGQLGWVHRDWYESKT